MADLMEAQVEVRQCPDPECGGLAEPERDGDHQYWSCLACGYDFSYGRLETSYIAEDADGNCSVGVPAEVRRAFSGGLPDSVSETPPPKPAPVPLGLTIGRRSSD